jgi:hypothetical protein
MGYVFLVGNCNFQTKFTIAKAIATATDAAMYF